MGMPSISISFTETGTTAISRGERGSIAMILKDAIPAKNPVVCKTESDVPVSLSEASKEQIALAFKVAVSHQRQKQQHRDPGADFVARGRSTACINGDEHCQTAC